MSLEMACKLSITIVVINDVFIPEIIAVSYDCQESHYLISWPFIKHGNYTGAIDPERKAYVGYLAHPKILPVVEIMNQCNISLVSVYRIRHWLSTGLSRGRS